MVTRQHIESKLFPEVMAYAQDILPRRGLKDLDVNGQIISVLLQDYGGVNVGTLCQLLEDAGAFGGVFGEKVLKRYPALAGSQPPVQASAAVPPVATIAAAPAQQQAVTSPAISVAPPPPATTVAPAVAPAAQPTIPQATASAVPAPAIAPTAPPTEVAPVSMAAITSASLKFQVFRDVDRILRTVDGQYVCAMCIKQGIVEPFCGKSLKALGAHTRTHADKDKTEVDYVEFPTYVDVTPVEPSSAVPAPGQAAPVIAAPDEAPPYQQPVHSTIPPGQIPQESDPEVVAVGNKLLLERIDKLESTLAQLVLVLLTLPKENLQALFEHFGSPHLEKLSAVLGRR